MSGIGERSLSLGEVGLLGGSEEPGPSGLSPAELVSALEPVLGREAAERAVAATDLSLITVARGRRLPRLGKLIP